MPKLTFYRQLRMDGGTRTGIEADGDPLYGLFEPGPTNDDPRLRWFVDLRCEIPNLSPSPKGARAWLLANAGAIRQGFERFAGEFRAGVDLNDYPLSWDGFTGLPGGARAKIVLTAILRVDAIEMSRILTSVASNWEAILRSLKPEKVVRN